MSLKFLLRPSVFHIVYNRSSVLTRLSSKQLDSSISWRKHTDSHAPKKQGLEDTIYT